MRSVLFAAFLLAACNNPPPAERVPGAIPAEGDVVLKINGELEIHENGYNAVIDRIPPEQRARMESAPGGMTRLEEQLAMSQILYTKALEQNLHKDPSAQAGLAMAERDYLAAKYVQSFGEKAVTDEAIAKRYEERKVQYARPQVKARHILVKEESEANDLKAKIDGGADFAELAKAHSLDPGSKEKGGELGWFEKRRMDPAFGDAAFAAAKGETVGPVKSRFGYHIIHVLDTRDSVPLEEVRDEIAGSIRQDAIQEMIQGLQTELKIERPGQPEGEAAPAPNAAGAPAITPSKARPLPTKPQQHPGAAALKKKMDEEAAKKAEGDHENHDGHNH